MLEAYVALSTSTKLLLRRDCALSTKVLEVVWKVPEVVRKVLEVVLYMLEVVIGVRCL